jgi:hypothetical protein
MFKSEHACAAWPQMGHLTPPPGAQASGRRQACSPAGGVSQSKELSMSAKTLWRGLLETTIPSSSEPSLPIGEERRFRDTADDHNHQRYH